MKLHPGQLGYPGEPATPQEFTRFCEVLTREKTHFLNQQRPQEASQRDERRTAVLEQAWEQHGQEFFEQLLDLVVELEAPPSWEAIMATA